jgi:hypothetical protein
MRMASLVVFTAMQLTLFGPTLAAELRPNCGNHDFAWHIAIYEGCIATKAEAYERSGDSAESVATAAVGACDSFRLFVEKFIDCESKSQGVGAMTMSSEAVQKRFHDYGVQAAIEFRTRRLAPSQSKK